MSHSFDRDLITNHPCTEADRGPYAEEMQTAAREVRAEIRSAGSDAQRPSQKLAIVVVSRARMAQTAFVKPAVRDRVIECEAGIVHRPGSACSRGLRELAAAITARKAESRAARTGSRAVQGFDPEFVTFPWGTFRDSGLDVARIIQLLAAGALRRAVCFAPFATAPPRDPRSIWILRPLSSVLLSRLIAITASSASAISTNPKPRQTPALSLTASAPRTCPARANRVTRSILVTDSARLPT